MYKVVIPFDESTTKCFYNGEPLPSNEEINVDTNLGNQIYCVYDDGATYRGLAMKNEPETIVDDLYTWYKDHGEKYSDDTIVLVPVFDNGDKKKEDKKEYDDYIEGNMNITLQYNGTKYTIPVSIGEMQPVKYFINKIFSSDQWYTKDAMLVNQETQDTYNSDESVTKEGVYNVMKIFPYITFKVDGDILQFADSPNKKFIKYKTPDLTEPPKLKVKNHYKFTGWTSSKGNWNNIRTSLNNPVEFVGNAILKQWTVKFKDCGSDIITKTVTVTDGDMVTPPECKKTGYTLKKWKEESFCTCKSSNISIWLLVILFIISVIVVFIPSKSSYIRNITRGIQSKTSY